MCFNASLSIHLMKRLSFLNWITFTLKNNLNAFLWVYFLVYNKLFMSTKITCWNFNRSYIKLRTLFGKNWHLHHVESSNPWHISPFIYLGLFSFLLSTFYHFKDINPMCVLISISPNTWFSLEQFSLVLYF